MIRDGTAEDLPFLVAMLSEAAFWRPGAPRPTLGKALTDHHVARYIQSWGRPGDRSVVAEDETGRPIGAAWYRIFGAAEPGYGFVDEGIPELTVAVAEPWRGRGTGTRLLEALVDRARADGFPGISLSVEEDNPALRLYTRLGSGAVSRSEGAVTMLLRLSRE